MIVTQMDPNSSPSWQGFNPVKYDPTTWAFLAKDAGVRYVVITAKPHEGFVLYPSDITDWETCMTIGENWGYTQSDTDLRSPAVPIHNVRVPLLGKAAHPRLLTAPDQNLTITRKAVSLVIDLPATDSASMIHAVGPTSGNATN